MIPSRIEVADAIESIVRAERGKRPLLRVPTPTENMYRESASFWQTHSQFQSREIYGLKRSRSEWQLAFFGALVIIAAFVAARFV